LSLPPLYSTGGALFLAIGLISASWLILALVAVVAIRLAVVPLEERELAVKFGSRYLEYARQTGGMAPRIAKRR
jgi:protein-S-isoprenylcysteine O-methyltransferase Ste14